jgi:dual specificity phosphatase 12
MGWVDLIPRCGNLYIGGLHALYQKPDLFAKAGITHILSVLDFNIYEAGAFSNYTHLHIRLDDDPNENLLQHFRECIDFISKALDDGGAVFVHCAMGKSRSATICCAYLMEKWGISPDQALIQVCEGRPVCDPNPGFKSQLIVWGKMVKAGSQKEKDEIYELWVKERRTASWWDWDRRYRESKL